MSGMQRRRFSTAIKAQVAEGASRVKNAQEIAAEDAPRSSTPGGVGGQSQSVNHGERCIRRVAIVTYFPECAVVKTRSPGFSRTGPHRFPARSVEDGKALY